jgi:hypothetical protein
MFVQGRITEPGTTPTTDPRSHLALWKQMGCPCGANASSLAIGTTDADEQPPRSSGKEKGCKNTDSEQLDRAHRWLPVVGYQIVSAIHQATDATRTTSDISWPIS